MSGTELEERISRFEDLTNQLYEDLQGDSRLERVFMRLNEAYTNRNWENLIKAICLMRDIIRDQEIEEEVSVTDYTEEIEYLFDWK